MLTEKKIEKLKKILSSLAQENKQKIEELK